MEYEQIEKYKFLRRYDRTNVVQIGFVGKVKIITLYLRLLKIRTFSLFFYSI